ncbi:hypothetical protein BN1708_015038 [Verticillium longisporum]|uniref:Uncharacterized protein n=1 Tax=Verticillium longisporum TaxID=100787 RepID=A0A0G4M129_VERLO|nr:hypothetical protein BN1708_015038 [Verticillium longisporum]
MDANPAPGAVPAVAGIDKVVAEPAAAAPPTSIGAPATAANPIAADDAKTADEPAADDAQTADGPAADDAQTADGPAADDAQTADGPAAAAAPKAATVEDASDKGTPVAVSGTAADTAAEPSKPIPGLTSTEDAAAAEPADKTDVTADELVQDKPIGANGLEPEGDGAAPTNGDAKKRKPGRPPKAAAANGTENGNGHGEEKEGLGEKLAKKVKKVLPTPGKTARKTRSQVCPHSTRDFHVREAYQSKHLPLVAGSDQGRSCSTTLCLHRSDQYKSRRMSTAVGEKLSLNCPGAIHAISMATLGYKSNGTAHRPPPFPFAKPLVPAPADRRQRLTQTPNTQHPPRVDHNKPRDSLHSSAASPLLCGFFNMRKGPRSQGPRRLSASGEKERVTSRDQQACPLAPALLPSPAPLRCARCARSLFRSWSPMRSSLLVSKLPLGLQQWGPFSPFGNL